VDFSLNDEQQEFQRYCRRFAREVIRPVADKHDREQSVPWDVIKQAREWASTAFRSSSGSAAIPRACSA
jgi:alkylation response protein AidB-like acyl-CoA dehydrogenase